MRGLDDPLESLATKGAKKESESSIEILMKMILVIFRSSQHCDNKRSSRSNFTILGLLFSGNCLETLELCYSYVFFGNGQLMAMKAGVTGAGAGATLNL